MVVNINITTFKINVLDVTKHFPLILQVSGKRFWGLLQTLCGTPENFFKTSFVYNYLPQQWMTATGCNLTPSDFKVRDFSSLDR